MNLFGGQKLEVCFYARYLYLNKLIGYVDLLDFYEHFPERLSDINAPNCLRLKLNLNYSFCNVQEYGIICPTSK